MAGEWEDAPEASWEDAPDVEWEGAPDEPIPMEKPKSTVSWSISMEEPLAKNWLEELANYQEGYEYGSILPFRKPTAGGSAEWAAPEIVKQAAQALLAPKRAYEGEIMWDSPEAMQQAVNLGGILQLGSVTRNLLRNAPESPIRPPMERVEPTLPVETEPLPQVFRQRREPVFTEPTPEVPTVQPKGQQEVTQVATPMTPEEVAGATRTEATRAEPINLTQFDTDQKVAGLIETTIGKMTPQQIAESKRGVISFEKAQELADATGYGAEFFLGKKVGTAYNAEQIQRFKDVVDQSSQEILDLATKVMETRAPEDIEAFKKAQVIHSALVNRFLGASSEAGRTLNQLKAMSQSMDKARYIDAAVQRLGGNKSAEELAAMVTKAAQDGNLKEFLAKGTEFSWTDVFFEAWKAGLLSGIKTQVKNTVSNTLTNITSIPERTLSAGIGTIRSKITGSKDKVTFKEVQGMMEGYTDLPNAFRNFKEAMKNEDYLLAGGGKGDIFEKAITAEKFRAAGYNLPPGSNRELLVDTTGKVIRIPFRVLNATDVGYKSLAASQQLRALAYRDAVNKGLTGDEFTAYVNQRINSPTKQEMEAAMDWAHYVTFTKELGKFGKSLQFAAHEHPLAHMLFPFISTPVNLAKYFVERTPLQLLSKNTRAAIKNGGAEADMALGKMAAGTAMIWGIGELVEDNVVSMPYSIDKAQAGVEYAAGYRPFAIKTDSGYIPIDTIDPVGSMVVTAASLKALTTFAEGEMKDLPLGEKTRKLFAYTVDTFNNVFIDKTYMSGFSDALDAVGSSEGFHKWAQSMAKSTTPTIFRDVAGTLDVNRYLPRTTPEDPTGNVVSDSLRGVVRGMSEAIQGSDPFTDKEGLRFKLDMWGDPVEVKTASMFNPFKPSPLSDNPLTLMRLKYGIKVPRPESETQKLGLDLTEDDKYRWQYLQGQYAKQLMGNAYENAPILQMKGDDPMLDKAKAAVLADLNAQAARLATQIIGVELLNRDKGIMMEELNKKMFPKPKRPDIVE